MQVILGGGNESPKVFQGDSAAPIIFMRYLSSHVTVSVSKIRNVFSFSVSIKTPKTDSAGSPIPTLKMTIADKDLPCRVQDPMSS